MSLNFEIQSKPCRKLHLHFLNKSSKSTILNIYAREQFFRTGMLSLLISFVYIQIVSQFLSLLETHVDVSHYGLSMETRTNWVVAKDS